MSCCSRCGVSDWHPEARLCTLADCELRPPVNLSQELRGRAGPEAGAAASSCFPPAATPPAAPVVSLDHHAQELAA